MEDQMAARQWGRQSVQALSTEKVVRAVYSERQLEEQLVDFWFNHFNVFAGKGRTSLWVAEYERTAIRPHVFGRFRDLLGATARSPAMLFYLDNWLSADPEAAQRAAEQINRRRARRGGAGAQGAPPPAAQAAGRRRGLNENYGRELLELHTLGVDAGYTQKDIVEVARAFTGWTITDPRGYRRAAASTIKGTDDRRLARLQRQSGVPDDIESEFYFNQNWHEKGPKTVLGQKIDEGGVN